MLTFVGCFDMIYLAAENGGKLFKNLPAEPLRKF